MNNGGNSLSLPLPSSPKAILGVKFILSTSQLRISLSEMVKRSKERPMKGSLSLSSHSLARIAVVTKPTQKEGEEERKPLSKRRVAFIQVGPRGK